MQRINHSQVDYYVSNRLPFILHKSAKATYESGIYRVFSYNTLIFKLYPDGYYELDDGYYSMTTSRLRNHIKKVIPLMGWKDKNGTSQVSGIRIRVKRKINDNIED